MAQIIHLNYFLFPRYNYSNIRVMHKIMHAPCILITETSCLSKATITLKHILQIFFILNSCNVILFCLCYMHSLQLNLYLRYVCWNVNIVQITWCLTVMFRIFLLQVIGLLKNLQWNKNPALQLFKMS